MTSESARMPGDADTIIRALLASALVAVAVFIASTATLAALNVRKGGINLAAVFAPGRFTAYTAAATLWAMGGLLYVLQAARPDSGGLATLYAPVLVAGWAASLGLWLLGFRYFTRPDRDA